MSRQTNAPHSVQEIEHCWIPMADGKRLSARIWLPFGAENRPVPAILEYIPYRKRDGTRVRDELIHRFFAEQGYAALRVDIRGSGESEGIMLDEFMAQEQEDALACIDWISKQAWCDGNVGMMGKSWGGVNSLQIAALAPPALKAVVAVCATDDRYADDVHYMGGCLLTDNVEWGSILQAFFPRPPDPALHGETWESLWQERLEALVCPLEILLSHQTRDDYWRHGSVCEDYDAVACPVYLVDGWTDGYSNTVFRMLESLKAPRKALIGPWTHVYPHDGNKPGPAIGFLHELLRWWDHWLKGEENGIMDEPVLRAWMQESEPPSTEYAARAGRWVCETAWPPPRYDRRRLWFGDGRLGNAPLDEGEATVRPELAVGACAGDWGCFGLPHEHPEDQRADDARSCLFDSEVLDRPIEILGAVELSLTVSVDRPTAMLAARLCDVRPDGSVVRVTYGLLNLTHSASHTCVEALQPGQHYDVVLRLNEVGYVFPPGHRIRVALSTSYWPIAWPSPEPVTATLNLRQCSLILPVRPLQARDESLPEFSPPEAAPEPLVTNLDPDAPFERRTIRDPLRNSLTREVNGTGAIAGGRLRFEEIGLEVGYSACRRYDICLHDPNSAEAVFEHSFSYSREDWCVEIESRTALRSSMMEFLVESEIEVRHDGKPVLVRQWAPRIARRGI